MPTSTRNPAELAAADHPFYRRVDELVVTRDLEIVDRLPCERILLPRAERWPSHHIAGHVGRRRDGSLHALLGGEAAMLWHSADGGVSWTGDDLAGTAVGAFAVLPDDTFLRVEGAGDGPLRVLHSEDGSAWHRRGTIERGLFDAIHIDGNLLVLRDGSLRLAVDLRLADPADDAPLAGTAAQYLLRSEDGGATWSAPGDMEFWERVKRGEAHFEDDAPGRVWPGPGGTFPGVYETGFRQLRDGRLLGAFRFSGPPRDWHRAVLADWGKPPAEPDAHGRWFRHIVLGESTDGGCSWVGPRPVVDADGRPLLAHGECNGELVELRDGRLVLVHQTRYAEAFDAEQGYGRGRSTLSARVSDDGGASWRPERWRLLFGFGYPSTVALEDDTLVTVCGCCLGDNGDPRRAAVVRWRVD